MSSCPRLSGTTLPIEVPSRSKKQVAKNGKKQFTDEGLASFAYWTIIGAYIIPGEKNDTHTMLDAVVYVLLPLLSDVLPPSWVVIPAVVP